MARILIAEDEALVRDLLVLMLELEGYAVTAVPDGEGALAKLRAHTYDLAVVDMRMAGLSGLDALVTAAREGRPVRALVLTGDDADGAAHAAAARVAARLLTKPIGRQELLAEVEAALAGSAMGAGSAGLAVGARSRG